MREFEMKKKEGFVLFGMLRLLKYSELLLQASKSTSTHKSRRAFCDSKEDRTNAQRNLKDETFKHRSQPSDYKFSKKLQPRVKEPKQQTPENPHFVKSAVLMPRQSDFGTPLTLIKNSRTASLHY